MRRSLAILWVIAASGCAVAPVHVTERALTPGAALHRDAAAIPATGPSRHTREALAQFGLDWRPRQCARILAEIRDAPLPRAARDLTIAEVSLAAAHERPCRLPRDPLLIDAARLAWGLLAGPDDDHAPPDSLALTLYDRAVAELLAPRGSVADLAGRAASLGIRVDPATRTTLAGFDRFIDAGRLEFTGLLERHRRAGVGAPLVAVTGPEPGWQQARPVDGGYAQAVTAVLRFDAGGDAALEMLHSSAASLPVGTRDLPLAADFTAPLAWQLGRSRLPALESAGAFSPARVARDRGLLLLEPFDPRRIPVLMIHGFWSSPLAWRNITNEILGTPDLRRRFQVWHYFYPTGGSFLYSAGTLRRDLAAFIAELRAAHGPDAVLPIVVIGHSQGGLLARSLITCSGWALWDTVFRVPSDSLAAPPAMRAAFVRTLVYEPMPEIGAVLLMATPNGGTRPIRNSLRAFLLNAMIDLPDGAARALRTLRREHPEQLRLESRRWFERGGLTALESMAPDNELMQVFSRLPFAPQVRVHSIVALHPAIGFTGDGDEYVPRESEQVPRAESELTVRARHQDIDDPAILAEVRRVLRLRAGKD